MYGRLVSVGTLQHHYCHTGDRAGDFASPVYRVCALYVVVTAAALGLAALKASAMDMLLNEAGGITKTAQDEVLSIVPSLLPWLFALMP